MMTNKTTHERKVYGTTFDIDLSCDRFGWHYEARTDGKFYEAGSLIGPKNETEALTAVSWVLYETMLQQEREER